MGSVARLWCLLWIPLFSTAPSVQAKESPDFQPTLLSHMADHPQVRQALARMESSLWSSPDFDRAVEKMLGQALQDPVVQKRIEPVLGQVFADPICRAKALQVAGDARTPEEMGQRVAIYFNQITSSPDYFRAFSSGPIQALNELHAQKDVRAALSKFRDRIFADPSFDASLAALMRQLRRDPRGQKVFKRLAKRPDVLLRLEKGEVVSVDDQAVAQVVAVLDRASAALRADKRMTRAVTDLMQQPEQVAALRDFLRMFFADEQSQRALFIFYRTLFLTPDDEQNLGQAVNNLFRLSLLRTGMAAATIHLLSKPAVAGAVAASLSDLLQDAETGRLVREGLLDYLEAVLNAAGKPTK